MKIFNKTYLLGLLAAAVSLTACDYEDDYVPGRAENTNSTVVFFPETVETSIVLGTDDTAFTVTIAREDATEAAEIPLQVGTNSPRYFTIPHSVKFEAGETETEIEISISKDFPMFETHNLALTLPENCRVLYGEYSRSYQILLNVIKEDYVPYAKGMFYTDFLSGMFDTDLEYEMILEYSSLLDTYRLVDPWYVTPTYCKAGYNLTFKWDKDNTNAVTFDKAKYEMGFLHPNYGMVTANSMQAVYRPDNQQFLFLFEFTVGAGSFGTGIEEFTIMEVF